MENPRVSRVFYRSLDQGETDYYRLTFDEPGTLTIGVNSPQPAASPPRASISGGPEEFIIRGSTGEPEYEAFAPDVFYPVGKIQTTVSSGTYTVTVSGRGAYALVVGEAESFTLLEWILTAAEVPLTRLWSGRWWILLPGALPILTVFLWLFRQRTKDASAWLTGLSGAFCFATSLTTLTALGWSSTLVEPGFGALVAIVLGAVHAGLGVSLLRLSQSYSGTFQWRLLTAGVCCLAFLTWAGAVIGPVLGLLGAGFPANSSAG